MDGPTDEQASIPEPPNPFQQPISAVPPPPPPLFQPPTLEAPAFEQVPTPMSVVIDEQPKRRRAPLFAGIAVLVVAALGVGGFFLLKGDDKPTYSLKLAAQAAQDARVVAMTMKTSSGGTDVSIDATADKTSGLMQMTMNLGSASPLKGDIDVIVDSKQGIIYMAAAPFADLGLKVQTKWIKLDREGMQQAGGETSVFDQFNVDNPTSEINYFTQAKTIKDDGVETIDGEQLKHYEVTIDSSVVLKADKQLQQQVDQLGGTVPKELDYDIYVTKDNVVRRLDSSIDIGPSKLKSEVTFHQPKSPTAITVPAAKDVTNFLDLLKQG